MKGIQGQICDRVHHEHDHKAASLEKYESEIPCIRQIKHSIHSLFYVLYGMESQEYYLVMQEMSGPD